MTFPDVLRSSHSVLTSFLYVVKKYTSEPPQCGQAVSSIFAFAEDAAAARAPRLDLGLIKGIVPRPKP
jgi:hypothetical protein